MEFLHPCRPPPAAHEGGGAFGLARMRKARLDLLAQHLGHVDLQCGLHAAEAPCLSGLVRRAGLGKRQRIACAGPRGVEGDAPDDPMVGMKSVRHVGIEREQNIGFRGADLAHELLAQVEAFDHLRVRVAQKCNAFDAQHFRVHLLLSLANARHLRARLARVARSLVARGSQHEVDDSAVASHQQDGAGAVVLDVIRVGDYAQRSLDAFVLWSAEELRHYCRDSRSSSCARATAFAVTPPLIIRATSRARSSSEVSSLTDTTFRTSGPGDFSTSRWWSAKAAICARCVTTST